ncbi:unnamed protein product [marine sediment metagenome]|uniref:Uncharacterized protein n=1 Tax=marine sediment metagenome TaxID=412755 RepID=X1I6F8_9ZZZZ
MIEINSDVEEKFKELEKRMGLVLTATAGETEKNMSHFIGGVIMTNEFIFREAEQIDFACGLVIEGCKYFIDSGSEQGFHL